METEMLENPVLKSGMDPEAANLLKMAQAADAGEEVQMPNDPIQPHPAAQKPVESSETIQAGDDAKAAAERARDEQGRFTKPAEATPELTKVATQPEKPDSDYVKAQKERERRAKTWQGLQEEKNEIQRARAEMEQQRREWETTRQQQSAQPAPQKFSSQQYDGLAEEYDKAGELLKAEGDYTGAAEKFAVASRARAAASGLRNTEMQEQARIQQDQFTKVWQENAVLFDKEVPGVLDRNSELGGKLAALFQEEPMFNYHPQGLRKAYEILQLREKAAGSDAKDTKIAELTAELAKFQKKTAISGEGPSRPTTGKKFDDLSVDEMGAELKRMAEMADS